MCSIFSESPICTQLQPDGPYTRNRGAIYYSSGMDKVDNPGMIPLLKDAYKVTVCHEAYQEIKPHPKRTPHGIQLSNTGYASNTASRPDLISPNILECRKEVQRPCAIANANSQKTLCEDGIPTPGVTESMDQFKAPTFFAYPIVRGTESGYTRYTNPNPTDGRVLDPVHLGQDPRLSNFGPSVTHMDYPFMPQLTGKEIRLPLSQTSSKNSGYWLDELKPNCFVNGEMRRRCAFQPDYLTSYQAAFYSKDLCSPTDEHKVVVIEKQKFVPPPDINMFEGPKPAYVTVMMDSYRRPQGMFRTFLYPSCLNAAPGGNTNSIFPARGPCDKFGEVGSTINRTCT